MTLKHKLLLASYYLGPLGLLVLGSKAMRMKGFMPFKGFHYFGFFLY